MIASALRSSTNLYSNPIVFETNDCYVYKNIPTAYSTFDDPITMLTSPYSNEATPFGCMKYSTMNPSSDISNTTTAASTSMPTEAYTSMSQKSSTIDFQQPLGIVDKYVILSELGQDHLYPVYLAASIYDNASTDPSNLVVLKAIPADDSRGSFENEMNIFQLKAHKNLLKCKEIIKNAKFFFSNQTNNITSEHSYHIFVLEYQPNGDLLEYVKKCRFDERAARFYFGQILDAMEYLHLNGFCHRDLKIENILLDENFNLVLTDFGHTVRYQDKLGQKIFNEDSHVTTPGICPPEFHAGYGYKGIPMDIFALGKLLLIFVTGFNPFKSAKEDDPNFAMICKGQWSTFWKLTQSWTKKRFIKGNNFSKELKALIESMLNPDPNQRVSSIQKIRESAWFKKTKPATEEEIRMLMLRNKQMDADC